MHTPNRIIAAAIDHHRAGRLAEAEALYRRVLAQEPRHADALHLLGVLAYQRGQPESAADLIGRAIAIAGRNPGYLSNLGLAYEALRRLDEAVNCYLEAMQKQPGFVEPSCNLAYILAAQGRPDEAVARVQRAIALRPDYAAAYDAQLFLMLYSSASPDAIAEAHRRYAGQFEQPIKSRWPPHANPRDPERRLRLGYVSPDFRAHAVALFMEPLLEHHDPARFEVYCYYNHAVVDDMTRRMAARCGERWVACHEMSDDALAARIRGDGIDILVDLAGHTQGNRLLVFARKPAPVQVTYLGYPTTTGLSAMDWRLTTWDVDPEGGERWYSERLYRLPRTLWCYRSPRDVSEYGDTSSLSGRHTAAPQTTALSKGHVTFGSMNHLAKVSEATVKVWGTILRELPSAHLVMTNVPEGAARERLKTRFGAQGVPPERLELHERLPVEEFYRLSKAVDIALDPFPYNGTTTTCEALWMGLPVITLIGETSVSRSGYAILKTVGLEEFCAKDEAEYARLAVELARDLPRLDALRRGMRARIEASPLRDEEGLARDVEAAYRTMWREWCEVI
jgi:protein O-GlcNAc transferase